MEITLSQFMTAFTLTLIAGAGTAAGSVLAFFCPKDDPRTLSLGLGFSAGVMIYISFMELLPAAIKDFSEAMPRYGDLAALFFFFSGVGATLLIDKLIPADVNPHEPKADLCELKICPLPAHPSQRPTYHSGISVDHFTATYEGDLRGEDGESGEGDRGGEGVKNGDGSAGGENSKNHQKSATFDSAKTAITAPKTASNALKRTGLFTALAITIHNFPEGFATFASALDDLALGIAIAAAVAIHNIPEGLAVSLPIYRATSQRRRAFILSSLSGLAEPIGALIGALFLLPFMDKSVMAATFAAVAGVMIFISLDELLPSARTYDKAHDSLYGLVGGMAVMALSLHFF